MQCARRCSVGGGQRLTAGHAPTISHSAHVVPSAQFGATVSAGALMDGGASTCVRIVGCAMLSSPLQRVKCRALHGRPCVCATARPGIRGAGTARQPSCCWERTCCALRRGASCATTSHCRAAVAAGQLFSSCSAAPLSQQAQLRGGARVLAATRLPARAPSRCHQVSQALHRADCPSARPILGWHLIDWPASPRRRVVKQPPDSNARVRERGSARAARDLDERPQFPHSMVPIEPQVPWWLPSKCGSRQANDHCPGE